MKRFQTSRRAVIVTAVALMLMSACLLSGVTIAKYVQNIRDDATSVVGKSFYFESDYLTENGREYALNAGTDEASFELRNYENELRVTEMSCTYEVTVTTTDPLVTINGESSTTVVLEAAASVQTQHTVTLGDLNDGYRYAITVTANGGYTKTLSAVFTVATQNGFYMNVTDYPRQNYVLLTVWSENVTGDVTVTVPAGLIPDGTAPMLSDCSNYEDGAYVAFSFSDADSFSHPFASRSYRFFKTASYGAEEHFRVEIDGRFADESMIP